MRIILSAALTADHFLDDNTPQRLMISTAEDWAAVCALRTQCDAILVGAETLRRDNPSLLLRDDKTRIERQAQGLKPDITKITLTRSGKLDPTLHFFTRGDAERLVFCLRPLPELEDHASVIVLEEPITARSIVRELEKRGIRFLLVEGGATILEMFLREGLADQMRLAINPHIKVGEKGHAPFDLNLLKGHAQTTHCGEMEVKTYTFHADTSAEDRIYLTKAIDVSRNCTPCGTCYRVGAVIKTHTGQIFTGYTHESSPTHHAEQEAIAKALAAGADLRLCSIYSSMEPCSQRSSESESCSELIIRHGFSHVAFALYEPSCFVQCQGADRLRKAGIDVRVYPELGEEVLRINRHLFSK